MGKKTKKSPIAVDPSCLTRMTELVLPSHTNAHGTIFGGVVMSWVDVAGAIAAQRYARAPVVTVSIDYLHFIVPIRIGYAVNIEARVNYAGRTSMEVEVEVFAENTFNGDVRPATRAFLTYVAVDEFGRPKPIPEFHPVSAEQRRRFREAQKRRELRLQWREHSPD